MRFAALLLILAACPAPLVVSASSADVAAPEGLDFGPTALNFSRIKPLSLTNRGRVPKTVFLVATPPFFAPESIDVPGGSEVPVQLTFRPTSVGPASGTVRVDGVAVALSGTGVAPLECAGAGPCASVRFDPESLSCVTTNVADGTTCEDELACIEGGTCQDGACIGRAARCEDGDACTADACAVGRGCQHTAMECAPSNDPCKAPSCDPLTGCGLTPVQDGTPCGAVSCELANVCLAGQCRAVVPPDGFTCSPESACRGEGVCRNKACVQPAERTLAPRWVADPALPGIRFDGVVDEQGNFYWVECATTAGGAGVPQNRVPLANHECQVVSRTSEGLERFRTSVKGSGPLNLPATGTQLIAHGLFIFVASRDHLAAVDTHTGVMTWDRTIANGHLVYALAADGAGGVWATVEDDATPAALVKLDARTGSSRVVSSLSALPTRLFSTENGDALVTLRPLTKPAPLPPTRLERYGSGGQQLFSAPIGTARLEMVLGDQLVFADDSVRSAVDGRELSPPNLAANYLGVIGVSPGRAGERMRLMNPSVVDLPPAMPGISLETLDASGVRQRPFSVNATRVVDPFLTTNGDVLFTANRVGIETRVQQVHRLGVPLMSCALVDDAQPAVAVTLGARQAFNGRVLLVFTGWDVDCASCLGAEADYIIGVGGGRVLAYDLGRSTAPGLAAHGWVGWRGSPGASGRAR